MRTVDFIDKIRELGHDIVIEGGIMLVLVDSKTVSAIYREKKYAVDFDFGYEELLDDDLFDLINEYAKTHPLERKPKLTKEESIFAENALPKYNWIVRNKHLNRLVMTVNKPVRRDGWWDTERGGKKILEYDNDIDMFEFVKVDDIEPYNINSLLGFL